MLCCTGTPHVHVHATCTMTAPHVYGMRTSSGKGWQPWEPPSTRKQQTAAGRDLEGQHLIIGDFGRGVCSCCARASLSHWVLSLRYRSLNVWSATQSQPCSPLGAGGRAVARPNRALYSDKLIRSRWVSSVTARSAAESVQYMHTCTTCMVRVGVRVRTRARARARVRASLHGRAGDE